MFTTAVFLRYDEGKNMEQMVKKITTQSPYETEALGENIAKNLVGGEVVELLSDLGGGKTTFTRGLVRGIGSTETVASPTFTISKEYGGVGSRLRVYHFDFYRLKDAALLTDEIAEIIGDPESIVVVEWADIIKHVLPKNRVCIKFSATGENTRELTIQYPQELAYIMEGV